VLKTPLLTLMIPTAGRDTLARCLESIRSQEDAPSYEVIVIGDTYERDLSEVRAAVKEYGPRFRYTAHDAEHHCFGHCQLNHGLTKARGRFVHCQDDDDIYAPNALATIAEALEPDIAGVPHLFRFRSYWGPEFWVQEGLVQEGLIGGHCLVAPRKAAGQFTCRYTGDFDWVKSTLDKSGGKAIWHSDLICIARPA
jgi:cellulose synthase/poly-beta-1,6-N-acetylglucosamine synthase-like glycosyltransferase